MFSSRASTIHDLTKFTQRGHLTEITKRCRLVTQTRQTLSTLYPLSLSTSLFFSLSPCAVDRDRARRGGNPRDPSTPPPSIVAVVDVGADAVAAFVVLLVFFGFYRCWPAHSRWRPQSQGPKRGRGGQRFRGGEPGHESVFGWVLGSCGGGRRLEVVQA